MAEVSFLNRMFDQISLRLQTVLLLCCYFETGPGKTGWRTELYTCVTFIHEVHVFLLMSSGFIFSDMELSAFSLSLFY